MFNLAKYFCASVVAVQCYTVQHGTCGCKRNLCAAWFSGRKSCTNKEPTDNVQVGKVESKASVLRSCTGAAQ